MRFNKVWREGESAGYNSEILNTNLEHELHEFSSLAQESRPVALALLNHDLRSSLNT